MGKKFASETLANCPPMVISNIHAKKTDNHRALLRIRQFPVKCIGVFYSKKRFYQDFLTNQLSALVKVSCLRDFLTSKF
jgi:hypothetical protein